MIKSNSMRKSILNICGRRNFMIASTNPPLLNLSTPKSNKPKLVVLGTGWAGFYISKFVDVSKFDLHVVSPTNHFLFTPLLASTTVGTLEFRCVAEPIHTAQKTLNYIQAECLAVDETTKRIRCSDHFTKQEFELGYDKLVIAVGAENATWNVPGVKEHAHFLKSLRHSRRIRQRLIECFERASNPFISDTERRRLLTVVVTGAGPTSVEFCGELSDFIRRDVARWFPHLAPLCKVMLIEASQEILGTFDKSLSAYARRVFKQRDIDVLTNSSVSKVEHNRLYIQSKERGKMQIDFGICIWNAGITGGEFLRSLPFEKDGWRLKVDKHLRVNGMQDVFAVGDCSATGLPATAQVASQEAKYLVKLLEGRTDKPFEFKNFGSLAYIGNYDALVDGGKKKPKMSGLAAFLVWRGAYLTMLMSVTNKILVPMYWFKAFFFGRDVTRF